MASEKKKLTRKPGFYGMPMRPLVWLHFAAVSGPARVERPSFSRKKLRCAGPSLLVLALPLEIFPQRLA